MSKYRTLEEFSLDDLSSRPEKIDDILKQVVSDFEEDGDIDALRSAVQIISRAKLNSNS